MLEIKSRHLIWVGHTRGRIYFKMLLWLHVKIVVGVLGKSFRHSNVASLEHNFGWNPLENQSFVISRKKVTLESLFSIILYYLWEDPSLLNAKQFFKAVAHTVSPQVWLGLTYVDLCVAPGAVSVPTFK